MPKSLEFEISFECQELSYFVDKLENHQIIGKKNNKIKPSSENFHSGNLITGFLNLITYMVYMADVYCILIIIKKNRFPQKNIL